MRYIAEFYLNRVHQIATVVVEAESLDGALEIAEGMATEHRNLINVVLAH